MFICPVCQNPLIPDLKTWSCQPQSSQEQVHTFDVAKQGHVNLLLAQHKKSKAPGDALPLIQARKRFLAAGHYQRVLNQLLSVHQAHRLQTDLPWLDVGCGDGYYTHSLLQQSFTDVIGIDVSKAAVQALAKRAKSQLWNQHQSGGTQLASPSLYPLVVSAARLPVADASLEGISSLFAPILPQEFARVLVAHAPLVVVKPAAKHMLSIRKALFERVQLHDSHKFIDRLKPVFNLVDQYHVQQDLSLTPTDLQDFLIMTPYAHRAKASQVKALHDQVAAKGVMATTACFEMFVFTRTNA